MQDKVVMYLPFSSNSPGGISTRTVGANEVRHCVTRWGGGTAVVWVGGEGKGGEQKDIRHRKEDG